MIVHFAVAERFALASACRSARSMRCFQTGPVVAECHSADLQSDGTVNFLYLQTSGRLVPLCQRPPPGACPQHPDFVHPLYCEFLRTCVTRKNPWTLARYDKPRLVGPRTGRAEFSLTHVRRNLQYMQVPVLQRPGIIVDRAIQGAPMPSPDCCAWGWQHT